jgi:hypothetical protein
LNSSAGPKGGGQDARNKVRQDTPYRRLATNGGEKCGLEERSANPACITYTAVEWGDN